MNWTKKAPNLPGIYWLRDPDNAQKATVVEVRAAWKNGEKQPYAEPAVWWLGWDIETRFVDLPKTEWYGPLEPPPDGDDNVAADEE